MQQHQKGRGIVALVERAAAELERGAPACGELIAGATGEVGAFCAEHLDHGVMCADCRTEHAAHAHVAAVTCHDCGAAMQRPGPAEQLVLPMVTPAGTALRDIGGAERVSITPGRVVLAGINLCRACRSMIGKG